MSNPWDDPDARAWAARVERELVPMIEDSAASVSIVPTGETDIKFAVELGISIMLDKPIILLVVPGARVPAKLARIADAIIEGSPGDPELGRRIHEVLDELPET